MKTKENIKQVSEDEVNWGEILRKGLYHWPLYTIVIVLSIACAMVYLRYTQPVYSSSIQIYIKDEKKAGAAGRQADALEGLSLLSGSKLVENEMVVIKSPLILKDVIRDNKFNIRYFSQGRFNTNEWYENPPLKLISVSDSTKIGNHVFEVHIQPNNTFELKFRNPDNTTRVLALRQDQPFSIGKDSFTLEYNPFLNTKQVFSFQLRTDSILQMAYRKAAELSTALVNKQSSVFEMKYEDGMAKRSADFLNAIADRYNRFTLDDKNQTVLNTINFIDTRLQSLGSELNVIERDVEIFKKERGITEIEQSSKMFLDQVQEADKKLDEAKIQLEVYDQIDKYVSIPGSEAPFTPLLTNVDQALASLINRYQELQSEAKRLSLSVQPTNPILENVNRQIVDIRNTIKNYISGYRRNAATAKGGLQRKVNEVEGMISKIPGYERQFINLKRQQSVKESLYLFLLQKREESAVSYASNIVDNRIISPAYIPERPVSPQRLVILTGFILTGIVLASICIYLKYFLSNKVTSKNDIIKEIDLPLVAEVYKQDEPIKPGEAATVVNNRTVLAEQILNMRNNLKFSLNGVTHTPIILFTSSVSGEGKTFLSSNLASSLTYNNKKVIMVELDLRKPKLAKSVNVDTSLGFSNYVIGQKTLEEVTQRVRGVENLYIIPSGPIPPNPIELLESEKVKQMFSILREQFDFVIIDTSPIGLVSDAKSLASFTDYSFFVVRFNVTPKAKLREVSENIDPKVFKRMGLIFNGVDLSSSYAQYGYNSNVYGYGYATENTNKRNFFKHFFKGLRRRII